MNLVSLDEMPSIRELQCDNKFKRGKRYFPLRLTPFKNWAVKNSDHRAGHIKRTGGALGHSRLIVVVTLLLASLFSFFLNPLSVAAPQLSPAGQAPLDGAPFPSGATSQERSTPLRLALFHGWLGSKADLQPLAKQLRANLAEAGYSKDDLKFLLQDYPNNLSLAQWSENLFRALKPSLGQTGDDSIVMIGYSMGGKAAIHALVNHSSTLAAKVRCLITINTPYTDLEEYEPPAVVTSFCRVAHLWKQVPDKGVCSSLASYDSTSEALQIKNNTDIPVYSLASGEKHILGLSCNLPPSAPIADPYPQFKDDGNVPLDAQSPESVKVIHYGDYCHWDVKSKSSGAPEVLARKIVNLIKRSKGY